MLIIGIMLFILLAGQLMMNTQKNKMLVLHLARMTAFLAVGTLLQLPLPNFISAQVDTDDKWPEHPLTIIASTAELLEEGQGLNPETVVLKALAENISNVLGVPVQLVNDSRGDGVLAANKVASSKPDAYTLGAIGADAAISRVAQAHTPYLFEDITPVAIGWNPVYVLVLRADILQSPSLEALAKFSLKNKLRLAHDGLNPVSSKNLMLLEASKKDGINWVMAEFKDNEIKPSLLISGKADAAMFSLAEVKAHIQDGTVVAVAAFSGDNTGCGNFVQSDQVITSDIRPFMAFYVPAKVKFDIRVKLSKAINDALMRPQMRALLKESCLEALPEDLDGVSSILSNQYALIEEKIQQGGYMASMPFIGSSSLIEGLEGK